MARSGSVAEVRRLEILVFPTKDKTHSVYQAVVNGWGDVTLTTKYIPDKWDLAVFDANVIKPKEINAPKSDFSQAWNAGAAILLLDPTPKHKEALAARVAVISRDFSNAVFISHDASESQHRFSVRELFPSPAVPPRQDELTQKCPQAPPEKPKRVQKVASVRVPRAAVQPSEETVIDFAGGVLAELIAHRAEAAAAASGPPPALKNFTVVHTATLSYSPNARSGITTITNTFRGFLNQGRAQTFQLLIVQSSFSGNPGVLNRNDDWDRGWYTGYFRSKTLPGATNPMSWMKNIPATSGSPVQQSLFIDIEYKDPLGGYGTWRYEGAIHDIIAGWRANDETSGSSIGAVWAMNEPYEALRFNETWTNGMTFWGWIKSMAEVSVATFNVNAIGAWRGDRIYPGRVDMASESELCFQRLWCSATSPGVCWQDSGQNWPGWRYRNSWVLDFSPIAP